MNSFFTLGLLFFSFLCLNQQKNGVTKIGIEVMKNEVVGKDTQLVDVRFAVEYNEGHIEGALNINSFDFLNFEDEILKLDKQKPIYVYCYSGVRSRRTCDKLVQMGFEEIYDFEGGYKAWSSHLINN